VERRYNAGVDESSQETQSTPSRRLQFSIAALFGAMTVVALCAGVWVRLKPEPYTAYPVEGRVVPMDGTPIQEGVIEFVERDLGFTSIGHIENGKFELSTYRKNDGSPAGDYLVLVTKAVPPVHEFYGSVETTPLLVKVEQKKTNEFSIRLEQAK
jgi:hypothetical protein